MSYGARILDRNVHSRMSLIPMHARLKRCHACATNGIPLGCSLLSPVGTVNPVQTLKDVAEALMKARACVDAGRKKDGMAPVGIAVR
jgi:hypothetical protein